MNMLMLPETDALSGKGRMLNPRFVVYVSLLNKATTTLTTSTR